MILDAMEKPHKKGQKDVFIMKKFKEIKVALKNWMSDIKELKNA